MNRRAFLKLLGIAPLTAPVIVRACIEAAKPKPNYVFGFTGRKPISDYNPFDALNVDTHRYIREKRQLLVDGVFTLRISDKPIALLGARTQIMGSL